ncbi:hypothetical protein FHS19_006138 [Paenibacillus rhizosphaerae]|uniref:Uncharacterized protein n=1 Tax=Paenibacillus rhizosphaerae TaxID=297318 RepID=A0A839U193_9BACL|nr:hypothetical protein [Paenibacillus rhizosphaerae]MBB3131418.1 hypothetical protein [Paenibacillus rhizosphaerae]
MPHRKPVKDSNLPNRASRKQEYTALHPDKATKFPPSLNQIPKQEQD